MAGVAGAKFHKDILFAFGGGDPRITIAVLDGPVDRTHDCFRGARLTPIETAAQSRSGDGGSATAHGTHIASLIFGQPCSSVEGVAPLCRGLIAPIFSDYGARCTQSELAWTIRQALGHGAHIIHISAGWFRGQAAEPELRLALDSCAEANVLVVAADGGDGCGSLDANLASDAGLLLAVGAIDSDGQPMPVNRRGGGGANGLLSPGSGVMGAAAEGGVAYRSGANFAAALVTGIAGVLVSSQLAEGLSPDPRAARDAILLSATPRVTEQGQIERRELTGIAEVQAAVQWATRARQRAPRAPFGPSCSLSG